MNIRSIPISDYTYTLPENNIAHYPLPERDASRLLIYRHGEIVESVYRNIDGYLPADSLLVFNNTRVIEARLLFQKQSGGIIEIFCLEPGNDDTDIAVAMQQQGGVLWKCLIGGASKWNAGQTLKKTIPYQNANIVLEAQYTAKANNCFIIAFQWTPAHLSFADILHYTGIMPLPPYIKRAAETADRNRYQTVYAMHDGSVAAPTAGLHFTPVIFEKLQKKNIAHSFVTLHTGAGTFKPVKSPTLEGHEMHAELMDVSKETIAQLQRFTGNTCAVGTTSARTLESLYWMGVKIMLNPAIGSHELCVGQWEVYDRLQQYTVTATDALQYLLEWMSANNLQRIVSKTQLLIVPGYRFKIIRGLVTNFHQPQSTLLLLVAALAGHNWKNIYAYALEQEFRFLSYGDGCLIMQE